METFFLFAGEKSGDIHGGRLIKALRERYPDHQYVGVGGPEMRAQDLECIHETEDFEMMGFTEVLLSLPKIWGLFRKVRREILKRNPQVVILIDYPGFNIRMARALRKKGFKGKIVQYISPSVWAWGKGRIAEMAETLDLLLTIYPFEQECFADTDLKVHYVGNPVSEAVRGHVYHSEWKHLLGIKIENLISIFPGSRRSEIQRNLPLQLDAATLLKAKHPELTFGVSCAHVEVIPVMYEIMQRCDLALNRDIYFVPQAYTYELIQDSRSAIAKSGSVTLELALHERPSVVIYKVSWLNSFIVKNILRLKIAFFCIVNILRDKEVFPELIREQPSARNISEKLELINADGPTREECLAECQKLKEMLGEGSTSEHAAKAIQELVGI